MLKALILFLKAPILFPVSLVNDVHSYVKFIEALFHFQILFIEVLIQFFEALIHFQILVLEVLILFFRAPFECLEEGIQRNMLGGSGLISCRAFALWKVFYPWHF